MPPTLSPLSPLLLLSRLPPLPRDNMPRVPPSVPRPAGGGIREAGIGGGVWLGGHQPDLQVGGSEVCVLLYVRLDRSTDLTVQDLEERVAVSTASWRSFSGSSASSATERNPPAPTKKLLIPTPPSPALLITVRSFFRLPSQPGRDRFLKPPAASSEGSPAYEGATKKALTKSDLSESPRIPVHRKPNFFSPNLPTSSIYVSSIPHTPSRLPR